VKTSFDILQQLREPEHPKNKVSALNRISSPASPASILSVANPASTAPALVAAPRYFGPDAGRTARPLRGRAPLVPDAGPAGRDLSI
jgi:hypothetical protein